MNFARTVLTAVALVAASSPAYAAVNLVTNGSFETPPDGGLPFGCGTNCSFSSDSIPGWTNNGATSGQFRPGPPSNTSFFNFVPDGITTAYSNGGSISQVLSVTAVAGTIYSLSLSVGRRFDVFDPTATAVLNVGGNMVTATGVAPTAGNWSTYTASYLATAMDAGQSISVILNASGAQGNWDNVSVVAAVPEPATWALMILGFGIVGSALRRRRRTQVRFNFA